LIKTNTTHLRKKRMNIKERQYAALRVGDPANLTDREKTTLHQAGLFILTIKKTKYDQFAYVIGTGEDVDAVMEDIGLSGAEIKKHSFGPNWYGFLSYVGEFVHLADEPIPMDYDASITIAVGESMSFRHLSIRAADMSVALRAVSEVAKKMNNGLGSKIKIDISKFPRGEWSKNSLTPI